MKKLLLLALLLGIAVPSYATTYYTAKLCSGGGAAPNCTDANNGTSRATAELTIAAGIAHLSAGDTLIIGDGTYDEFIQTTIPGGSVGNHTIIRAENNRQAILFPQSLGGTGSSVIWIDESYITIDGLVVDATYVQDNGGYYIHDIADTVGNVTIQNGIVKNGITPASVPTSDPNGILLDQGVNLIVRNMEITNFRGHGIYNPSTGVLIENNYIHDWSPQAVITAYCSQSYPGNGTTGTIYRGNTCANWQNGFVIAAYDGVEIYNNIFYGMTGSDGLKLRYGSENAKVYFNTFYSNLYGLHMYSDSSGTVATDNIFYANINGPILDEAADSVCTYNLGVNGGESSSDSCSSTATASNPLFVNAAFGDFHTFDTSPALGAGIAIGGITTDKDGITRPNPPSMGPYEIPSGMDPFDPLSEDFESYAATSSIAGLNSGAGWTQSWVLSSGTITVENAGCSLSGKAFRQNTTNFDEAYRLFTAHTGSFSLFYKACVSTTSLGAQIRYRFLNEGGSGIAPVYFQANGNIEAADGTDLVTGFSANQAYQVEVNFDTANQPNKYRVKIDAGSYSAWFDDPSGFVSVSGFIFGSYATNAHTAWLDDISEDIPAGGTITNVTPLTGAMCVSGSTCQISWGSNGITGAVNVYYLVGGNQYLISSPDVAATPYTWTVNAPAGTTIKTRVSQGAVSSDSGEFTVRGTKAVFAQ